MMENIETESAADFAITPKQAGIAVNASKHIEGELAFRVHEIFSRDGISHQEKVNEAVSMITGIACSELASKEQVALFFYSFVDEMSRYDKTGDICAKLIVSDIFKKIYNNLGFTVAANYESERLTNLNAYNFDIFSTEICPLYIRGTIGTKRNILEDMAFPDRFLNIFFRAVRELYHSDLKSASNIVSIMKSFDHQDEEGHSARYEAIRSEIDAKFKQQISKIYDFLDESEQKRLNNLVLEYISGKSTSEGAGPVGLDSFASLLSEAISPVSAKLSRIEHALVEITDALGSNQAQESSYDAIADECLPDEQTGIAVNTDSIVQAIKECIVIPSYDEGAVHARLDSILEKLAALSDRDNEPLSIKIDEILEKISALALTGAPASNGGSAIKDSSASDFNNDGLDAADDDFDPTADDFDPTADDFDPTAIAYPSKEADRAPEAQAGHSHGATGLLSKDDVDMLLSEIEHRLVRFADEIRSVSPSAAPAALEPDSDLRSEVERLHSSIAAIREENNGLIDSLESIRSENLDLKSMLRQVLDINSAMARDLNYVKTELEKEFQEAEAYRRKQLEEFEHESY